MDAGLFDQGFVGQGFNWWIGQIADDSTWRDNINPGKFRSKESIPGWGYRYKVRIFGLHDLGEEAIASKNLPWANIMYPVTAGSYLQASGQTPMVRQGNIVFGFFLDGPQQQQPVIMGILGNNTQTSLATTIGDSRVTKEKDGTLGTSGYAKQKGGEPSKEATPRPPDYDKATEKPRSKKDALETATAPLGVALNMFGLPSDRNPTEGQLAAIQSAKNEAEKRGLDISAATNLIKNRVSTYTANKTQEANSPRSEVKPGATVEGEALHLQTAANIKQDAVYHFKRVLMKPDNIVESANKAMQTDMDNMVQAIDKHMNALASYTDAVSMTEGVKNLKKLISDSSKQQSKYMKVVMDKVMEFNQKALNKEMTAAVSALPSSERYKFLDLKENMEQEILSSFNGITGGMGGLLEGVISKILNLDGDPETGTPGLIEQAMDMALNPDPVDPNNPQPPKGLPRVPICTSEDVIASVMAASREQIDKTNNDIIGGIDGFIGDTMKEMAGVSGALGGMLSKLGNINGSITQALNFENITSNIFPFELPPNPAVSDFYTFASGGAGQSQTQLPNPKAVEAAVTKQLGNLAEGKIPNPIPKIPFATIPKGTLDVDLKNVTANVLTSEQTEQFTKLKEDGSKITDDFEFDMF